MAVVVNVKQEHIDRGVRKRTSRCPVALAIKEKVKSHEVIVCTENITISGENYKTPKSVRFFVREFDNGEQVKPFKFQFGGKGLKL